MLGLDPRQKIKRLGWTFHGLGLVMVGAVANMTLSSFFVPIDSNSAHIRGQQVALQRILDREHEICGDHERLTKTLQQTQQQFDMLMQRIPATPEEAEFLAAVAELADEVDFDIREYRSGLITASTEHQKLEVVLSAAATYESLCHFLNGLDHLPRHSSVSGLQILNQHADEYYNVEVTLRIYFAPSVAVENDSEGAHRG